VFFVGALPALLVFWIQRRVPEPELWRNARQATRGNTTRELWRGTMWRVTIAVTMMNAFTLFGWWGFNGWVPSYLRSASAQGGVGLDNATMSAFVVFMQAGMWLGYVTFGYVSDAIGRRRTYVAYLVLAAALVWIYASTRNVWVLFALGPVTAFFATGYFSGFGAVTAELYPTEIRATAQGLTYNLGRIGSAFAPLMAGGIIATRGYPVALSLTAGAFLVAAALWIWIPETRGRKIRPEDTT